MSQADTRERIIAAAETLFAERGFAETSLRLITSRADVNLASVNYHFGCKQALIQAVFDRFMDRLCAELEQSVNVLLTQKAQPTIVQVLALFVQPLQALEQLEPNGAAIFMRLLGRAYAETQGHLRRFVSDKYGHVLSKLMLLFQRAHPALTPADAFWRLHFMLGALVFAIGGGHALSEIASSDFNRSVWRRPISVL